MTETYAVTLERTDGSRRTIEVGADETVLEASERTDRTVPFGCRTGACGTCAGRLLEVSRAKAESDDESAAEPTDDPDAAAAFAYRREPRALKPRHREAGYVLLCIATPRADCRVAVGSRARSGLVDNPWK
ncbi:2Fe-2S iron-sulfur cluster binding domain-containing protein [Natronococcus sp. JC468]|uniref:2Fe-2S iron-sulfur cluster-binding protein n=1 Tax=Natronococcus sp. JC468 TaxID=1961921 RepID=UPI001439129D|nr:2Fe-2S iron-sulfur cluster-binding protein [Natronococcus sp. JC468]NKE34504.1 2Fe-2S iron-sulfur cluster binding domain-containing protein [Natronococcus sp. JC468]